ncbi:hypothetical protein [Micromonospora sp. NPDC000668]|uniref:hypothetical protein n=1 Tax=Micromonospora sp. NPDC000668 TaxID=3364219 RepID=UPI00369FBEA1
MNADRIDQETAERLLGGSIVGPSGGPQSVVLLMTAVRATPRPSELAGEDVAVQAFRRALAEPAVAQRPARRSRTLAGFGARASVAALALAAIGGVALAAATGVAPRPPHPPTATPTPPAATAPATPEQGTAGAPATTGAVPSTSVPAGMVGRCRAYQTVAGNDHGRALDNPVFSGLIAAAGGPEQVADYCVRVLAPEAVPDTTHGRPGSVPSRRPTSPGPPDGRPDVPNRSGTSRPAALPAGRPTAPGPDRSEPADRRPSPGDRQPTPARDPH